MATLQSLSPLLLESFEVQVVDTSAHGISVQLDKHLAAHSEVKIRRGNEFIFGEVRYCVPASGGFRAGIHIKEILGPTS